MGGGVRIYRFFLGDSLGYRIEAFDMTPKTNAERNARCAAIMGWVEYPKWWKVVKYEWKDGRNIKDVTYVIPIKDYSPSTKIEQALEVAFKSSLPVLLDPSPTGISVEIGEFICGSFGSLPDCARKIVETVLEVEDGDKD